MYEICSGFEKNKIPNAFIERYRTADGPSLKVALWLLFGNRCDVALMAEELAMPEATVARALGYWEKAGLIEKSTAESEPPEKDEKAPEKQAAPARERRPITLPDITKMSLRNPEIAVLLQEAQRQLGRTLTSAESARLLEIYEYDDVPVDVILMILAYSKPRAKRSLLSYVDRVAREWRADGIDTSEKAEKHLKLLERRERREKKVCDVLDIDHGALKYKDKQYIAVWFEEYGYNTDMVSEAFLHTGKDSVPYLNSVLKDWNKKGYRTVKDTRVTPVNAPAPAAKKSKGDAKQSTSLLKKAAKKLAQEI